MCHDVSACTMYIWGCPSRCLTATFLAISLLCGILMRRNGTTPLFGIVLGWNEKLWDRSPTATKLLINCHISGNLDAGQDINVLNLFTYFLSLWSKNIGGITFSYAEKCREPTKFKSLNLFQLCSKFVLYSFKLLPHPLKKNFPSSGLSRQTNDGHHSPSSPLLK